jgi:hypothetical protein
VGWRWVGHDYIITRAVWFATDSKVCVSHDGLLLESFAVDVKGCGVLKWFYGVTRVLLPRVDE